MSYDLTAAPGLTFVMSDEMEDALREYIDTGIKPGDFLTAVICNDLVDACGRADHINLPNLPAFASYLYNEAPADCWGSKAKMDAWIARHEEQRERDRAIAEERARRDRRRDAEEARGDDLRDQMKDPDYRRDR